MSLTDDNIKTRVSQLLNEKSNTFADLNDYKEAKAFADNMVEMDIEIASSIQVLLHRVETLFHQEQEQANFEANSEEMG